MPSKLEEMQQRFRERLVLEKEEKMIRIYSQNQQKVLDRVAKANSALSTPSCQQQDSNKKLLSKPPLPTRKHGSGVDRSRPLKPIQLKTQNRPTPNEAVTRNGASSTANQDLPDMATRTTTLTVRSSVTTTRPKPAAAPVKAAATKSTTKPPASTSRSLPAMTNGIKSSPTSPVKPAVNGKLPQTKSAPAAASRPITAPSASSTPKKAAASSAPVVRTPPVDPNMGQCSICGRNFDKERLAKHMEICKKTSVKKRRVFDTTKMRVKGTEAEQFVRKGVHKKEPPSKGKKSDWRVQHENFISSIRQAKAVQEHLAKGGKLSDLPPPKPSENPDYVQCPHCQRKFNEAVAERHIPKCKNILSNKKKPPAKK